MRSAKRLRIALFNQNPHCENCGVLLILPENVPGNYIANGVNKLRTTPDNMATIQHIHPRDHPDRGKTNGQRKNKLWCFKCNMEDNREQERLLGIEKLRERAKRHPMNG